MKYSAIRTLKDWTPVCGAADIFPLIHHLTSCLEKLLKRSAELNGRVCNEEQWTLLDGALNQCIGYVQESLAHLATQPSAAIPAGMDPTGWLAALKSHPNAPSRTCMHKRFSDGIQVEYQKQPARTFYSSAEYRAPPVLEVLQSIELTHGSDFALCLICNHITGDIHKHANRHHPREALRHRPPTMQDVVQQALDFASQFRSRGLHDLGLVCPLCLWRAGADPALDCPFPAPVHVTQAPACASCCVLVMPLCPHPEVWRLRVPRGCARQPVTESEGLAPKKRKKL